MLTDLFTLARIITVLTLVLTALKLENNCFGLCCLGDTVLFLINTCRNMPSWFFKEIFIP